MRVEIIAKLEIRKGFVSFLPTDFFLGRKKIPRNVIVKKIATCLARLTPKSVCSIAILNDKRESCATMATEIPSLAVTVSASIASMSDRTRSEGKSIDDC